MITHKIEQGSDEWLAVRLGIATASNFDRIITPKTMKPSSQMDDYVAELVAERLIGQPLEVVSSPWMERGTHLEASARKWYAFHLGVTVETVGFIERLPEPIGCSPDGLVEGDHVGLEIKCPSAKQHVRYMLGDGLDKYRMQVLGSMYVTGRTSWDLVSYNPRLPSVVRRYTITPDETKAIAEALEIFVGKLDDACERLDVPSDWRKRIMDRLKENRPGA